MNVRRCEQGASRRDFLALASLAAVGGFTRRLPALGQAQETVVTFRELRGNVGIFIARGGTIGWYVSSDAVAVIDSQYPDTAKICLDGLNRRSGNHRIDYLLITHYHGDHTAGNGVFRPATGKIVAHERVPELQRQAAAQQKSEAAQTYPDTVFSREWTGDLGKEQVRMEHFGPAHTGGDAIVRFERADIVHMGDLVFNRRHPYIDRPAGASIAGWIQVLEKIAGKFSGDTLYIYGHAQQGWEVTGRKEDLLYQRDYLSALLERVRAEIKAGKSREQITGSTEPLRGFPDHGPLNARVLQAAYDELAPGA